MADVIANVADGITTGSMCWLFILSSVMLIRTSSLIWGRWCLPVSVQGWIVDPYVYNFFFQPHEAVILPPHYTEIVQYSGMTCDVIVVINWGRGLKIFSKPLSKCPSWFSYILLITFQPVTLLPIYDATLFGYVVFVFGCHHEVFDGLAPLSSKLVCHASCICFWSFH